MSQVPEKFESKFVASAKKEIGGIRFLLEILLWGDQLLLECPERDSTKQEQEPQVLDHAIKLVFPSLLEPHGTSWNLTEPPGTFWNLLKPPETLLKVLKTFENS